MTLLSLSPWSRRKVLLTGVASATALSIPRPALASPRWTRKNVTSTGGKADLEIYRAAIEAMHKLPPDDARNWYRIAVMHLLDCPHANWWFFNWHRPFLGYFEQICRELTGEADFALPYWDWTAQPALPDPFWKSAKPASNILDPRSDAYLADGTAVVAYLDAALDTFWDGLSPAQKAQIAPRWGDPSFPVNSKERLKLLINAVVVPRAGARGAKAQAGELADFALDALALPEIETALGVTKFNAPKDAPLEVVTAFNSQITDDHNGGGNEAAIESGPHDNVHGSIDGMMGRYMSPVDPIFWLHHANIDRLWTVWDERQRAAGRSTEPSTDVRDDFNKETYLFFVDALGAPVTTNNTAGEYMGTGRWDYDYTPGSGTVLTGSAETGELLVGRVLRGEATLTTPAEARLEPLMSEQLATRDDDTLSAIAVVSFSALPEAWQATYRLYLTRDGAEPDLSENSPDLAASHRPFGPHGLHHGTKTVSLPVTGWLRRNPEALRAPLSAWLVVIPSEDGPGEGEATLTEFGLFVF